MTWHIPEDGCEVSVKGDADDVITIACVNTQIVDEAPYLSRPHRYECARSLVNGALMVIENDGFGNIRYLNGAEAKQLLVDDEVWTELPTFFRNTLVFA